MLQAGLAAGDQLGRIQWRAADKYSEWAMDVMATGRKADATTGFQKALSAAPDHPGANFNMGVILAAEGKHGSAVVHYRKVVKAMPDFAGAHFNLAQSLATLEKFHESAKHFQRAAVLQPENKLARTRLHQVLRQGKGSPQR